jgi:hypothetical protein
MDKIIRLKGSDKVFLVKSTKHWLKTAETLTGLGYNFGDEVEVDASEFANYEEGEPIEINGAMKEPEYPITIDKTQDIHDAKLIYDDDTAELMPKEEGELIHFAIADNDIPEPVKELWQ